MGETSKRVAVIGCGVTGLAAVKCCLDEGLQPTCFERSDGVGGLWYYRDDTDLLMMKASVYRSTVTNTSKEATCYSDFPFPKEWPNFLHNSYMKKYLDTYADEFGLKKHIHFSTKVTGLAQAPDYETTGRWIVTYQPEGKPSHEEETSQEFDAVMVCTGMFTNPVIPEFPGLDEFQGEILHSQAYRKPDKFEGKRVVVVGVGNSAGDAATDLSRNASQVYLSVRRGAWIFSRRWDYSIPWDLEFFKFHFLPAKLYQILTEKSLLRQYGMIMNSLLPAHGLLASEVLVSEDLPGCILNGSVIVKANIARLTKTGVEFEDGTYEDGIDTVIMATGYKDTLPFKVDCQALEMKQGHLQLYKLVFPLGLKHSTLSINGAFRPLGGVVQCVELQARWAARVFKGLAELPSQADMEAEVKATDQAMERFFLPSHRLVNPLQYAYYIASEIGVKPRFLKLFFTDPVLALRCLFGPHVPYQFRLVGPGKWPGARKAINTVWERVLEPTKTRPIGIQGGSHVLGIFFVLSVALLAILATKILISIG